ncbi:hypothetical protein DVH24_036553 [Malus domestica]|uniref:Uncharacterized protein n=1 Tax=Malus domestica TaxID=3750 RepID=A0A498IJQ9_MALDO|nr:hypothetical protein DVH24_036553 [Malus domestica]
MGLNEIGTRGFPVWLKFVPGISFRTNNEPFKFISTNKIMSILVACSSQFLAIELWKTNMRHPQASEVVNKDIISHFFIAEPKKNTRGPNRMLKELQLVRMSASLIKIAYDERHRGAVTSQQHNSVEFLSYVVGELGKNSRGDEDPGVRQFGDTASRKVYLRDVDPASRKATLSDVGRHRVAQSIFARRKICVAQSSFARRSAYLRRANPSFTAFERQFLRDEGSFG